MRASDLRAVLVAAFALMAGTAFGHDEGSQAPGARPTAADHSGGRAHGVRRSGDSSAHLSNTPARPNGDPPPSTSSSRERGAY